MNELSEFLATFRADQAPDAVRHQIRRCLADTIGVGFGGASTRLSRIIRDHAAEVYPGLQPLAYDGRGVNAAGQALAFGMTVDALDGHDGFNPAKGHVGAGLIPALIALGAAHDLGADAFETALIAGYEAASHLALALHGSVPDYHTSGAWVAVAIGAAGAQMLGLDADQVEHAAGIAEYHGPRSQMMRCIDHPTMLKDGSGWGAMAGVSAVMLAARGFTGAPALTTTAPEGGWDDLGTRWLTLEQYFKPYPVCRWAQGPVEAILHLKRTHGIKAADVAHVEVITFHESTRLATNDPRNTEEAQYSTAYPAAVALVRGKIGPEDLDESTLNDPEVKRIAQLLKMREDDYANARFPEFRPARASIVLNDGSEFQSDWMEPRWDALHPPEDTELQAKFVQLVTPARGTDAGKLWDFLTTEVLPTPKDILAALSDPARLPS